MSDQKSRREWNERPDATNARREWNERPDATNARREWNERPDATNARREWSMVVYDGSLYPKSCHGRAIKVREVIE